MSITCREDLKNYCLRALGAPALQINVTPEQIDDRIQDTLEAYWEWHHEGNYIDFISRPLTQLEIDTKEFVVDEWVYQVLGIMMLGSEYSDFNLEYTAYMQNLGSQVIVLGEGMSNYVVSQSYLSMVRDFFSPEKRINFNQNQNKIRIHSGMSNFKAGDYLVLEVYRFSDPDRYRETWNDWWIKAMATAQIKKQWGQNMLKYSGFQLPSGITLNGREIYQDALNEIEQLNNDLFSKEGTPPDFFVG